jgi:hypothetical protein
MHERNSMPFFMASACVKAILNSRIIEEASKKSRICIERRAEAR